MRLAIFGAENGIGRLLAEEALAAGHDVRTHAADPRDYPLDPREHDRLRVIEGDAFDVPSVEEIVHDADAVCSAIGASTGHLPGVTPAEGTENVLAAMEQFLVPRIVSATAAGVGASADYASLGSRLRALFDRERFADLECQERLIRESDREWVIVRPARLTNGPRTNDYRAGPGLETGLRATLSRADLAAFMLQQVDDDTYLGQAVTIAD